MKSKEQQFHKMYYHLQTVNDNYSFIHRLLKKLEKNDIIYQAVQTSLSYHETLENQQNIVQTQIQSTPSTKKTRVSNVNLKQQILELAQNLDDIMQKQKDKKMLLSTPLKSEFKAQQLQIKEQMIEIEDLRQKVRKNQRKIQFSLDDQKISTLENQLTQIQQEEEKLKIEFNSIKKIQKQQQLAIGQLNLVQSTKLRDQLKQSLQLEKKKYKLSMDQLKGIEAKQMSKHEVIQQQSDKLRWIDQKVKDMKKIKRQDVTEDDVQILENQLSEILDEIDTKSQKYTQTIKQLDKEKKTIQNELEQYERMLKEKDKEYKLSQLRYNELSRQYRKRPLRLEIDHLEHRPNNTPIS
ncbi:hypothetical protein pb186bvf_014392 [Paramecium bursaria]